MKLSKVMALGIFGCAALGFAGHLAGCSSTETTTTPTTTGGQPPAKPTAGATTSTDEITFALNSLSLGDADRAGTASNSAWKGYGFNLDKKATDSKAKDVCTLQPGAGSSVQVDGTNGIDNSFGANILPIVINAAGLSSPSKTVSDSLTKGSFTILMNIKGLSADAKQTNTGLTGQLFAGGAYDAVGMTTPAFDSTTDWPVRPELLNDGKTVASGSKVRFSDAYVVRGTFVNGSASKVTLSLAFGGVSLDLTINQAVITFDHSAPGAATNGTIAGVLDTEELINGLKKVAGRISPSLCSGSTFDGIASQIRGASDIMSDGNNAAGSNCNGISVGLGFTAKQIKNPSKVADLGAASPDPCAAPPGDAGAPTDAGKD